MSPARKRRPEDAARGALELTEEAFHLLRQSPLRVLAAYAVGSVPFVLGLLYFWADMSRSAFAAGHVVAASLGLALLFLWMKCWHAVFATELKARVTRSSVPVWTPRRMARLAAVQLALQPYGLIAIPLALGAMLPFYVVHGFFQNVTVFGDGRNANVRETAGRAWRQALLWPRQHHVLIWLVSPWVLGTGLLVAFGSVWLAMSVTPELHEVSGLYWFVIGILLVFNLVLPLAPLGCVVAGNVAAVVALLPALWQMFTGEQTLFMLTGLHGIVNTTFLTAVFGLTYLLLDPLCKAVHVLRGFYGEAVSTGEDLRTELRDLAGPGPAGMAVCILAAGLMAFAQPCAAGGDPAPKAGGAANPVTAEEAGTPVTAERLGTAIDDVLARPEYAWRMPRERVETDGTSLWGEFFRRAGETIRDALRAVARFMYKVRRWMQRLLPWRPEPGDPATGWETPVQSFLFVLLALSASVLALLVYRAWRKGRVVAPKVQAQPVVTAAALLRDEVTADRLPSDEWMALARDLFAKGETRLALRAMFLGALAHLAHAGRLTVARGKSNREYRRELERKAHDRPDVLAAFADNVGTIERVWYGDHPATAEQVETFTANQQRLLGVAPGAAVAGGGSA